MPWCQPGCPAVFIMAWPDLPVLLVRRWRANYQDATVRVSPRSAARRLCLTIVLQSTNIIHHQETNISVRFIFFFIFLSHRLGLLPSLWILLLYSRLSIISSELRPLLLPSTHICPSDCNRYWRSRPKKNKNILPVGSVNTTQSGLISYLAGHNGTDRSLNIPHRRDFFVCIKFLKYPKNSFLILIRSIRESVKRKFQSFYGLNL